VPSISGQFCSPFGVAGLFEVRFWRSGFAQLFSGQLKQSDTEAVRSSEGSRASLR
jgi:hypothetical protein